MPDQLDPPRLVSLDPLVRDILFGLRGMILSRGLDAEAIGSAVQLQIEARPKLRHCVRTSLREAVARAIHLGLDLSPGAEEAYLTPRKSRVALVPNYRGLLKLAYRHPRILAVESHVVFSCDQWRLSLGDVQPVVHIPTLPRPKDAVPIGAYAVIWWRTHPRPLVEWMLREEIDANARRGSATEEDSPWNTDWPQMARKTVLKRLLNYLPLADCAKSFAAAANVEAWSNGGAASIPQEDLAAARMGEDTEDHGVSDLFDHYTALIARAAKADITALASAIRADDGLDSEERAELFRRLNLRQKELKKGGKDATSGIESAGE